MDCVRCEGEGPHYANDSTCKECRKALVRAHRAENIEEHRAKDNARGCRTTSEHQRKRRSDDPVKYKAQTAVGNAVRDGRLARPDNCSDCGVSCVPHGHHEDYNKQLDVVWLCPPCHKRRH